MIGRFGFRPAAVGAVVAALALAGCNSASTPIPIQAPTAQSIAGLTPSGKVTMTQVFAGGMGVGTGALTFNGKTYPFKMLGTVVGPGSIAKIAVRGDVYKLDDPSQFSGLWVEGTGAVGLETAQTSDLWLQNKAGVVMHLTGNADRRDAEPRQGRALHQTGPTQLAMGGAGLSGAAQPHPGEPVGEGAARRAFRERCRGGRPRPSQAPVRAGRCPRTLRRPR